MESELFCIFWVKLAPKNIVLVSPGTQRRAASPVWCLSEEIYKFSEPDYYTISCSNVAKIFHAYEG